QRSGFSRERLLSVSREQKLVFMRQCIGRVLYENTDLSFKEAGKILGRNHATVINGMKPKNSEASGEKYLETYKEMCQLFVLLMESVLSDSLNFTEAGNIGVEIYSPFSCKRDMGYLFDEKRIKEITGMKHKKYLLWKSHLEPGSETEKDLINDYKNSASQMQLMKKYGISNPLLNDILKHNLGKNYKLYSFRGKLKDEIIKDFFNGLPVKAIEEKYNKKSIRNILLERIGKDYLIHSHSLRSEMKIRAVNYYKEGLSTIEIAEKLEINVKRVIRLLSKEPG
ncbi:MAG: helix-turn-helix domain-containing protein, partial [Bacteroidota bacterium]